MMHGVRKLLLAWGGLAAMTSLALQRFPPPDFESGHVLPSTTTPAARTIWWHYIDVGVLAVALGLATWLVIRRRSRKGVIALMLGSLFYFGFFRAGCVCAIGAVQNVALGLGDASYAVPWTVLAFFLLPLIVALFWGRSFCAAVCPHGAIQDAVLLKPVKVPHWLESALRTLPWIYLGTAIFLAFTGSAFIICRYDPFIGIFRLSGSWVMITTGIALLILSIFVGRPYCRFLCPYGALLGLCSRFSKWYVTITPDLCTRCRLCEDACPYGAIHQPQPEKPGETRAHARRRLGWLLVTLPLLVLAIGWAGSRLATPLSSYHPRIALAEQLHYEERHQLSDSSDSVNAFLQQGGRPEELYAEATARRASFIRGGWLLGLFIGVVIALSILQHAIRHWRGDYEADRAHCLSCARCFMTCPYEQQRRGLIKEVSAP